MEKEPKQVIMEQLRLHEQSPSDLEAMLQDHKHFFTPVKHKSNLPQGANVATLQFLREKSIPEYQVHVITFDDSAGISWMLFCLVVQDAHGNWHVEGCTGTAGNIIPSLMYHRLPSIFLYLRDASGHFYAGGSIIDHGRVGITKVRLLTNEKLIAEDVEKDGLVVFVSDQKNVQMPIDVELYNHAGELVRVLKRQP